MISISIDKREDNKGIIESGLSEYEVLKKYVDTLKNNLKHSYFIEPCVLRDKIKSINETYYFCSFDFRLKNKYICNSGASIYFKNNTGSENIAKYIYEEMKEDVYFEKHPSIAYYHDIEKYGFDFFAENINNSAVIFYIDYIENVDSLIKNKNIFCESFCKAINKIL